MSKEAKPVTLLKYLKVLKSTEKAVICKLCNEHGAKYGYMGIHRGMLPFLEFEKVVQILRTVRGPYQRLVFRILVKFRAEDHASHFLMRLDPRKVYRQFGVNPERGRPMPEWGKVKVTVGMRFSLPRKQFIPDDDVWVNPTLALKQRNGDPRLYEVFVDQKYRNKAELWLIDKCQ